MSYNNTQQPSTPLEPVFNSSLEYLKRISKWMEEAELNYYNDNMEQYLKALEMLEVEIISRKDFPNEKLTEIKMIKDKVAQVFNHPPKDEKLYRKYEGECRFYINAYHKTLNRIAHQLGLIMKDLPPSSQATRL